MKPRFFGKLKPAQEIQELQELLDSIAPGKGTAIVDHLLVSHEYKPNWYGYLSLNNLLTEDKEFVLDYCPNFEDILWGC